MWTDGATSDGVALSTTIEELDESLQAIPQASGKTNLQANSSKKAI